MALAAFSSLAAWLCAYAAARLSLYLAPALVLNAVLIVLVIGLARRREATRPANGHGSAAEENTAAALALIRNYEEVDALSKERTLLMVRRSKQLRESLKQQERLNDLQRSFVVMLSHEFRTPLAIMDSSAQKLKSRAETMPPLEIVQRATSIRDAIRRLTNLMDRMLASAKYEDGNLPLTFRRCELGAIILNCVKGVTDTNSSHRIEAALGELPEILGDKEALDQLFDNLLRNAIKYSPNADRVDIRAQARGDGVIVEIEDYGHGIDEDDIPNLFQRFFRAKNAEGIEGTGIGLSVVKLIAEQHGGRVSVVSRKGAGTTFTVDLPAADALSRSMPRAVGE